MKTRLLLVLLLGFAVVFLPSCNCHDFEWPDAEEIPTPAMLMGAAWDLNDVASWEMKDGTQHFVSYNLFGEGTDNGICTFSFGEDSCIMIDVEDEIKERLIAFDNNQLVIGDEIYTIQVLTETSLELLVGEQEEDASVGEVMRFSRD